MYCQLRHRSLRGAVNFFMQKFLLIGRSGIFLLWIQLYSTLSGTLFSKEADFLLHTFRIPKTSPAFDWATTGSSKYFRRFLCNQKASISRGWSPFSFFPAMASSVALANWKRKTELIKSMPFYVILLSTNMQSHICNFISFCLLHAYISLWHVNFILV